MVSLCTQNNIWPIYRGPRNTKIRSPCLFLKTHVLLPLFRSAVTSFPALCTPGSAHLPCRSLSPACPSPGRLPAWLSLRTEGRSRTGSSACRWLCCSAVFITSLDFSGIVLSKQIVGFFHFRNILKDLFTLQWKMLRGRLHLKILWFLQAKVLTLLFPWILNDWVKILIQPLSSSHTERLCLSQTAESQ